jgi:nucleotide-binding universal stress UspA family protein
MARNRAVTLNHEAPNARAADVTVASGARAQPILFVLRHTSRPRAALKMASALAAATQAELHLLSVLPHTGPFGERVDDPRDVLAAWRCIDECVTICRQTRAWFEETLEETLDLQRLRIRCGRPSGAIALRASELDARLVVLAPGADSLGPLAMSVARACSRPVLLARNSVAGGTVIAATDLRDGRYPVVRQASALGAALGARVVAVHNVRCLSNPLGVCPDAGARPVLELPRQMLAELPASLDLIVTTEVDPVGAILEQAQRHRSGVIVVGARSRSGRRSDVSVPLEVIARSRCSVLVTSLEA